MRALRATEQLPGGVVTQDMAGFRNGGFQPGYYLPADCRQCPSCLQKAINSRVGAMLAESSLAHDSAFLTLTYANDAGSSTRSDLAHRVLMKKHMREFTERIRRDRSLGRCRWFYSGEYGELYGRAHWHVILFGVDGRFPDFDYSSELSHSRLWPYGHINAKPVPDAKLMAYAAKYAVKSLAGFKESSIFLSGTEAVYSASARPPLGGEFFADHGRRLADYGVPLSFNYMPAGGIRAANYTVKGRSRKLMANAYLDRLHEMGFDVTRYGSSGRSADLQAGQPVPRSPDLWVETEIRKVMRERALSLLPDLTPEEDFKELSEAHAERQAVNQRILDAQARKRHKAAVARQRERSRAFALSFRDDPSDPFWDEFDARRNAVDLLRGGAWKYD